MRTAIVTGASRGLGREIALHLLGQDWRVIPVSRNSAGLDAPNHPVAKMEERWLPVVCDITDERNQFHEVVARFAANSGIDALFNVAGVYTRDTLEHTSDAEIFNVVATNLVAAMTLTKRVLAAMKHRKSGVIVNINSVASQDGGHHETAYAASKAGLAGFSRALRMETRHDGIQILDVYLGAMNTPMLSAYRDDLDACIDPREAATLICNLATARETLQVEEVTIKRRWRRA